MATGAVWHLSPRKSIYRCVTKNLVEQLALARLGRTEFEAVSIGATRDGPQVAIVPLDESTIENAIMLASAPALADAVEELLAAYEPRDETATAQGERIAATRREAQRVLNMARGIR